MEESVDLSEDEMYREEEEEFMLEVEAVTHQLSQVKKKDYVRH